MAYRILTTAAVLVAVALPALAETTKVTTSVNCYSHHSRSSRSGNWTECTRETQVTRPPPPSKPNCGYLPNFGINRPCP